MSGVVVVTMLRDLSDGNWAALTLVFEVGRVRGVRLRMRGYAGTVRVKTQTRMELFITLFPQQRNKPQTDAATDGVQGTQQYQDVLDARRHRLAVYDLIVLVLPTEALERPNTNTGKFSGGVFTLTVSWYAVAMDAGKHSGHHTEEHAD